MRKVTASRIMRTTLDLDPTVLRELKQRASREGKSLGRLASEMLSAALQPETRPLAPGSARLVHPPDGGPGQSRRPRGRASRHRQAVSYTIDANVLLYASDESSPVHGKARAIVQRLADGPEIAYLFWPTVMAYLRIATHPAVFERPLSITEAIGNVEQLIGRPHVRTTGETEAFWLSFRDVADDALPSGNVVPDAQLVTLMLDNDVRIDLDARPRLSSVSAHRGPRSVRLTRDTTGAGGTADGLDLRMGLG